MGVCKIMNSDNNEQPNDNVWISKEEYQRLQSEASRAAVLQKSETPVKLYNGLQIATTTMAGILFLAGLMFGWAPFNGLAIIPLSILLIQGYFLYSDYTAAHIPGGQTILHTRRNKILFFVTLILFMTPIIFMGGIIIWFILFPPQFGS